MIENCKFYIKLKLLYGMIVCICKDFRLLQGKNSNV